MRISVLSALFLVRTLFIGSVSANWAYMFVVNDGRLFQWVERENLSNEMGIS